MRFEFIGSTILLEKSNIAKSNKKSNNPHFRAHNFLDMLNLAFDSNYPAAYTYVEETEADDWSPGIHLHFVDYKALCLRLKRERLSLVTKHTTEDEVQEKPCSPTNGSPSCVPKSAVHKNNLSNFQPTIMKMINNREDNEAKNIKSPKIETNHKNNRYFQEVDQQIL
uniref:Uncharacterized protein n=1 Tax=Romanomermis culicivorax TaxID=13658 RepID=A0A915JW12_ROMCU